MNIIKSKEFASLNQAWAIKSTPARAAMRSIPAILAFAVAFALSSSAMRAATYTWDAATTTGTGHDGAGTWSTSNANWTNGSGDIGWTSASSGTDAAVFGVGGTPGTVTVSGGVGVGGITFNPVASGTYTITGSTITLNNATITTNAAAATINSVLAGSTGLITGGAGTLTLGGNNTFTGPVTVNAGTLQVNSGGSTYTLSSTNITINSGAIFQVAGARYNMSAGTLFNFGASGGGTLDSTAGGSGGFFLGGAMTVATNGGARDVFSTSTGNGLNMNGQTITFNVARGTDSSVDLLVSGILGLGNGGAVVKNGSGILALTATNNYAGATTINAGTLQLGNGGATGSIPGSAVSGSASATLAFDLSTSSTFSNTISGGLGVTQAGSGTTVLTGNNSFTGPVVVNGGTLAVSGNNINLSSTNITINSGATFQVAGQRYNIGAGTLFNFGASGGGTLDSSITSAQSQGGFFLAGAMTVAANGGAQDVFSTSGGYGLNMNGQTITFNVARGTDSSVDLLVPGILGLGSGAVVKNGSGIMALTATNNYSGTTTINAGTLQLGNGGATGSIPGSAISGSAGATLAFDLSTSSTVSNTISGGVGVTQAGSGTVTLTGADSYTGATTINAGTTLQIGVGGSLSSSSAISVGGSGALTFAQTPGGTSLTIGNSISGTGVVNLSPASGSYNYFTVSGNNASFTGTANINSGALAYVNSGANFFGSGATINVASGGQIYLDNSQTYTGNFVLSGSGIAGAGTIVGNGRGALSMYQTTLDGTISLAGNATLEAGNGGSASTINAPVSLGSNNLTFSNQAAASASGAITDAGTIGGAGGVIVNQSSNGGTFSLSLSGSNTFSGSTQLNSGAFTVSNRYALQNSPLNIIGGSLLFDQAVASDAFTFGGLTGSGNIALQNNAGSPAAIALTLATSGSQSYSGVLSGPGSVVMSGTGLQAFGGANTYTGSTTVQSGTLQVNSGVNTYTLSSTNITINSGAMFQVAGARYNIGAGTLFNFGASGGGTLDSSITSAQSQGGFFLAGAMTVATNGGAQDVFSTSGGYGLNMNGQTITFNVARGTDSSVDLLVPGILGLGNGGAVVKNGSGVMKLTATNNYSGATTLNAGTLQFGKEGSLYGDTTSSWTASNIIVASGATLALNVGGAGEFTSSDINMISGLGTGSGGLENGANLGLDTTDAGGSFTYANAIANTNGGSNAIGFTKLGTGTLVLQANSTYTGATAVKTGTLLVSGSLSASSSVAVATGAMLEADGLVNHSATTTLNGGTLDGTGSLGAVTANGGALAPGLTAANANSASGTLTAAGNVMLSGSTNFNIRVGMTSPTDSDMLALSSGSASLNNATLNLSLGSGLTAGNATLGQLYVIINGGSNPVTGTFANAATNGSAIMVGGWTFDVFYNVSATNVGVGGDDVDLELAVIPEPGTWAMMLCGLGMLAGLQRSRRRS